MGGAWLNTHHQHCVWSIAQIYSWAKGRAAYIGGLAGVFRLPAASCHLGALHGPPRLRGTGAGLSAAGAACHPPASLVNLRLNSAP
jgi:hypothetical protein